MKKALTALFIANLKPTGQPYYVGDAKQDGLRIRVAPDGVQTWNVTVRVKGGKLLSTSLGRCDPEGRNGLDLGAARTRASAILKSARMGIDLIAQERAERIAGERLIRVADLISSYGQDIASENRRGGALRTAREIQRRLERALDSMKSQPAESIARRDISLVLDKVAREFPREAEKRRQVIDAMYQWGVAKGAVQNNPASGLPSYGYGSPRDRVLTSQEIVQLWRWLDQGADNMPSDVIAVIRLQLLMGARMGEISGIDASELRVDAAQLSWTLPAERSKNKKSFTRPVIGIAQSIITARLEAQPEGYLFRILDRSRALRSDDVGLALNNRTRPIPHFTTHDIRRTVVSGLDELGVPLETIAAVVGHRRGGAETRTLIRHYSRPNLDNRIRDALQLWDDHLAKLLHPQSLWHFNGTGEP